jgi:CRP-like cAMP-binding protein
MARRDLAPAALLARLPLFTDLAPAALARLAAQVTQHRLDRGRVLFGQGEPALGLYVVVYGDIKLLTSTPGRGPRLTGLVGPGQSFGEPVLFLERPTLVQAVAASDALVLRVPKEAVFAELDRNPCFARQMIAGLAQRVQALVQDLDRQTEGTGKTRFVAYLLRHADGQPSLSWRLPATKREIAAQLNLTPEHLSRILRELVSWGLLQMHGRQLFVPDTARLSRRSKTPRRESPDRGA